MDTTAFLNSAASANTETPPNLEAAVGYDYPFIDGDKDLELQPQEAPEAGDPEQGDPEQGVAENISQEGFTEMLTSIKDFFVNRKPSVGSMKGGMFDRTSVVRKTLARTYLNAGWLARRQFVQGNISVAKYIAPITDNGSWAPDRLLSNAQEYHDLIGKVIGQYEASMEKHQRAISPAVADLPHNLSDLTYHEAMRLDRALYNLEPGMNYSFKARLGGIQASSAGVQLPQLRFATTSVVNIPALDIHGVTDAANAILKIAEAMDALNDLYERYIQTPTYKQVYELMSAVHEASGTGSPVDEDVLSLFERLLGHCDYLDFNELAVYFRHNVQVMKSYARLIDASVR